MKKRHRVPEALQILGLARRAGAVASGTDATRRSIRQGDARLVLMAEDASPARLGHALFCWSGTGPGVTA